MVVVLLRFYCHIPKQSHMQLHFAFTIFIASTKYSFVTKLYHKNNYTAVLSDSGDSPGP